MCVLQLMHVGLACFGEYRWLSTQVALNVLRAGLLSAEVGADLSGTSMKLHKIYHVLLSLH